MTVTVTPEQIPAIVAEAESAAYAAADQYFRQCSRSRSSVREVWL